LGVVPRAKWTAPRAKTPSPPNALPASTAAYLGWLFLARGSFLQDVVWRCHVSAYHYHNYRLTPPAGCYAFVCIELSNLHGLYISWAYLPRSLFIGSPRVILQTGVAGSQAAFYICRISSPLFPGSAALFCGMVCSVMFTLNWVCGIFTSVTHYPSPVSGTAADDASRLPGSSARCRVDGRTSVS